MKLTPTQHSNYRRAKLRIQDAAKFARKCLDRWPVDSMRIGGWV